MGDQEQTWVEQALAGDTAAFSNLVEAYQKPVYNLAYRMLGNSVEAEDAAQEAFIRAYTRLDTYDPSRKFSSWMLSIASHYCIDVLRRRRITLLSIEELPPMADVSMPRSAHPEHVVARGQVADQVQQLLGTLPEHYRTPIILRYWYDMSYREIAETMGVTESTIKTRLHRARARLAECAQQGRDVAEGQTYEQATL
ncbi:MAG TPA: sigma-70 family RNA polymerase sigma factor [Anaerolineae bacterium]|nr:sigma-70 family RNA polymerase sigma factor [Anaerolineae bacterium]